MSAATPTKLEDEQLQIEKAVYGGDGLARTPSGEIVFVPFVLPGELVETPESESSVHKIRILKSSPDRVAPRCIHFGVCGGCQYQMASYDAQLRMKAAILAETLGRGGASAVPAPQIWPSEQPYEYRNRIRLRSRDVDGEVRLGYTVRGSNDFLPVSMCPIATQVLWQTAEVAIRAAKGQPEASDWLRAAAEVEIFCDDAGSNVQLHLLCPGALPARKGSFERFAERVKSAGVPLVSAGASRLHVPSGRATEPLVAWGAEGMAYRVGKDIFWLKRGGFFQVNRLLIPTMVELVCGSRTGKLAWDLFAGAGLFARELARRFDHVTAVEANPLALGELQRGLRPKLDRAIGETSLDFLRKAVVQRDRPDLIVLDPPRAGAGAEACELIARLSPAQIVYVSCDPTTLARDLSVLQASYKITDLHLVDLFPQTYHLETVMVLKRRT